MIKYRQSNSKKTRLIKKSLLMGVVFVCIVLCVFFKNDLYKYIGMLANNIINISDAHVKRVIIIGASPTVEKLIKANLGIKTGDSIFRVSTTNMLNNLSKIGWIKEAIIHKILPNIIKLEIKERIPIAVYHANKKYTLIDETGVLITNTEINPGLPLISGADANLYVNSMLMVLKNYPKLKVKSLVFVQKRRWNLILENNVTIKLPDKDVKNALQTLSIATKQKNIIDAVTAIDMRIPGNVIMCGLKTVNSH